MSLIATIEMKCEPGLLLGCDIHMTPILEGKLSGGDCGKPSCYGNVGGGIVRSAL
jgi:hypothetical protein